MSLHAISWAMKQQVARSSEKFVLVCLANYANENGTCYPSVAALEADTGQDRKTVIRGLQALMADGFIVDTGKRAGVTRQIPVYRLAFDKSPKNGTVDKSSPKNGTVAADEQSQFSVETVPFFPENSTVFPDKGSQKRDTDTSGTVREPSRNREKAQAPAKRRRLDIDSLPGPWEVYCRTMHPLRKPFDEFDSFRDHHTAHGKTMLDWEAAWRTWLRNADRFAAREGPRAPQAPHRLTANQQMQQNVIGAIQGRSTRETFDVDATEVFTPLIAR